MAWQVAAFFQLGAVAINFVLLLGVAFWRSRLRRIDAGFP
jgi:hypothetical protein